MPDIGTHHPARPLTRERRILSGGQVAERLGHRLYLSDPARRPVQDVCALAVRHGLSSVIARLEVPRVGLHSASPSVGVVTILGWRDGDVQPLATKAFLAEARRLAADGATELGMPADVERLKAHDGNPGSILKNAARSTSGALIVPVPEVDCYVLSRATS